MYRRNPAALLCRRRVAGRVQAARTAPVHGCGTGGFLGCDRNPAGEQGKVGRGEASMLGKHRAAGQQENGERANRGARTWINMAWARKGTLRRLRPDSPSHCRDPV